MSIEPDLPDLPQLNDAQAAVRLQLDGPNTLAAEAPHGLLSSAPERDVLLSVRQGKSQRLFDRRSLLTSLGQGVVLLLTVLGVYWLSLERVAEGEARALAFVSMVVGNVTLITVQRSSTRSALFTLLRTRNPVANWLSAGALLMMGLVLSLPVLRGRFHFQLPSLAGLACAAALGCGAALWFDLLKLRASSRPDSHAPS